MITSYGGKVIILSFMQQIHHLLEIVLFGNVRIDTHRFIPGPFVPVVWGFVYANMAYMVGVVYAREYLVAGAVICVGDSRTWLASTPA